MIPSPREINQLEERIEDLETDLRNAEQEIHDADQARKRALDRADSLMEENRDWEGIAECARERAEKAEANHLYWESVADWRFSALLEMRERAEKAEAGRDDFGSRLDTAEWELARVENVKSDNKLLIARLMEAEKRAASWWEAAKEMSRLHNALRAEWNHAVAASATHAQRAEKAEESKQKFLGYVTDACSIADENLKRAEKAEGMARMHMERQESIAQERDDWMAQAIANHERAEKAEASASVNKWMDRAFDAEGMLEDLRAEHNELKAALRTLSE